MKRGAPYKDFLQPALQRRFVLASALFLVISYLEAVLVGNWTSYFWAWFPFFRTIYFFVFCAFPIVLLRIAYYHVGVRPTSNAFQTLSHALRRSASYEITLTYAICAGLFGYLYLFYTADASSLQWITYAHYTGDRARLSERPIFFLSFFFTLGTVHGVYHIATDVDMLNLGIIYPKKFRQHDKTKKDEDEVQEQDEEERSLGKAMNSKLPTALTRAATTTGIALVVHSVFYALFLRPIAWAWTLAFLRRFYNLPKSNMLPSTYPYQLWLFLRMLWSGSLLSFLWAAGNMGFTMLMKAEPLKQSHPLTSESKDPNGSLLNGIKNKKLSVRCFAMWELAFIARDFEDRRKGIFQDVDRKDGDMWSQVYQVCMNTLKRVESNVDNYGKKPESPKTADRQATEESKRRTTEPLKTDPVVIPGPDGQTLAQHLQKEVDAYVRSPGKTLVSELSPKVRQKIEDAKTNYLAKGHQKTSKPEGESGIFRPLVLYIIETRIGWLLQRDFSRRLMAAVFGPESCEISLYINTVLVLARLAANSLAEDQYGTVHGDVASLIRSFSILIGKLEKFSVTFPSHWMDGTSKRKCKEVEGLIIALQMGLEELLDGFGDYTHELKLSQSDVRMASKAMRAGQCCA